MVYLPPLNTENMPKQTLWGHPKGLYILFFTEMWERFSYYGMRAIFILYLTAKTTEANAGLGWDKVSALELYGWYTMLNESSYRRKLFNFTNLPNNLYLLLIKNQYYV